MCKLSTHTHSPADLLHASVWHVTFSSPKFMQKKLALKMMLTCPALTHCSPKCAVTKSLRVKSEVFTFFFFRGTACSGPLLSFFLPWAVFCAIKKNINNKNWWLSSSLMLHFTSPSLSSSVKNSLIILPVWGHIKAGWLHVDKLPFTWRMRSVLSCFILPVHLCPLVSKICSWFCQF